MSVEATDVSIVESGKDFEKYTVRDNKDNGESATTNGFDNINRRNGNHGHASLPSGNTDGGANDGSQFHDFATNNGILPGEVQHFISLVVTGNVIYACQLSPSMALFTLESRRGPPCNQGTSETFDVDLSCKHKIDIWNDGGDVKSGYDNKGDHGNLPQYVDVILKRRDGWESEQINAIHQLLEDTLADEQDDVYTQKLKQRKAIKVEGFPERMRPKFEGDTAPVCLHAQSILIGENDGLLFQVNETAVRENEKGVPQNRDTCIRKPEEVPSMPIEMPSQSQSTKSQTEPSKKNGTRGGVDDRTRFSKFVHFLISEFGGYETLSQKPVLDVAGGAGGLAFELCWRHGIDATVVDTKQVKLTKQQGRFMKFRNVCLEQLAKDHHRTGHKSLLKANLQSRFRSRDFVQLNTLLDSFSMLSSDVDTVNQYNEAQQQLHSILHNRKCSVMTGLHPDQATDPIVEIGLALGIPWAIVPCCVFPNFCHYRTLASGKPVRSYEDLCQWLRERDPSIREAILPFQGRNRVFYWHPPPPPAPPPPLSSS